MQLGCRWQRPQHCRLETCDPYYTVVKHLISTLCMTGMVVHTFSPSSLDSEAKGS
jgi:hypothetical protein